MTVYKNEPRHPIGKWTFIDFPTPQTSDDPINFSKTWNLAAWPRLPLCVDVFFLEGKDRELRQQSTAGCLCRSERRLSARCLHVHVHGNVFTTAERQN